MQKIKIAHRAKFQDKSKMFPASIISGSCDILRCISLPMCSAHATFNVDFADYFSERDILVTAWVGFVRARGKSFIFSCDFKQKMQQLLKSAHNQPILR